MNQFRSPLQHNQQSQPRQQVAVVGSKVEQQVRPQSDDEAQNEQPNIEQVLDKLTLVAGAAPAAAAAAVKKTKTVRRKVGRSRRDDSTVQPTRSKQQLMATNLPLGFGDDTQRTKHWSSSSPQSKYYRDTDPTTNGEKKKKTPGRRSVSPVSRDLTFGGGARGPRSRTELMSSHVVLGLHPTSYETTASTAFYCVDGETKRDAVSSRTELMQSTLTLGDETSPWVTTMNEQFSGSGIQDGKLVNPIRDRKQLLKSNLVLGRHKSEYRTTNGETMVLRDNVERVQPAQPPRATIDLRQDQGNAPWASNYEESFRAYESVGDTAALGSRVGLMRSELVFGNDETAYESTSSRQFDESRGFYEDVYEDVEVTDDEQA